MNKKDQQSGLYLTKEGLEKLTAELSELKEIKRPKNIEMIKEAREMGDISENAMYDAAREEQAFIEGRVAELEEILRTATITTVTEKGVVSVGSKVTVRVEGSEETFHIVGAPEADPTNKKISHQSPLGVSLMGKKIGEKIDVEAPIGTLTYTILRVE